tara:strand:+ start:2550 stop:2897 length:348 start_codon:yes stop_codon:yes gene_type:complete
MARKKKNRSTFNPMRMDEASHSELVQLARLIGHSNVSTQIPREDLEDLILGEEISVEDPLDYIREKIFEFIKGNSLMLSTLRCSTHCPSCPYEGVIHCFATNSDLVLPSDENPIT